MWNKASRLADSVIFNSRWLMFPINLGMVGALGMYVVLFLRDDYMFLRHSLTMSFEDVIVALLGLVDSLMVANLLTMITKGSYQIFIKKFQLADKSQIPQWLDHVDTGILKVKVAQSVASITLIHLLKDFFQLDTHDWIPVFHKAMIHLVCLASALIMSLIWRVTHPKDQDHEVIVDRAAH